MPSITRDSLMTLEAYARERAAFRARVGRSGPPEKRRRPGGTA